MLKAKGQGRLDHGAKTHAVGVRGCIRKPLRDQAVSLLAEAVGDVAVVFEGPAYVKSWVCSGSGD